MRLEMSKETKGNWFITPAELENSPFLKAVDKPRYNIFFPQAYGLVVFFSLFIVVHKGGKSIYLRASKKV